MNSLALCEWTTIRGTSATSPVNQPADQWLDVSEFLDVVFWVDFREASGPLTLNIQTSPSKDEACFKNMLTVASITAANGPTAYTGLASSAPVPVAAWLRWQLTSSATPFVATFRIWLSANSPGR
jgi:hypothetical protein